MNRRLVLPVALLSAGLLTFGLQPAHAAGSDSPRPVPSKLGGGLSILADAAAAGRPVTSQTAGAPSHGAQQVTMARVDDGDVLVNVYVDGSMATASDALRGLGMRIGATNAKAPAPMLVGWLSADQLMAATAIPGVKAMTPVRAGVDGSPGDGTDVGGTLSQGDAAHHGPQARALGPTGKGVKVGVISDSANQQAGGVATSISTGDLPAGYQVLTDDPGASDEGRAMSEIIYDTAPGITQMAFSSGTATGAPGKAASIAALTAAGAKIIADDIFYLDEPMFQDGQVAQAVDAATTAGVNYFASAGNRAKQSWEGTFNGGTNMDFDPGAGVDTIQTLGTWASSSPFVSLQWAEPWGAATTDFALDWYVDDVLVASTDDSNIGGVPNEFEQITFSGTHAVGIGIRRVSGTGTPQLKYIAGGKSAFTISQFPTNSNAINPDAASAAGSMAVAASSWSTPTTPESYSSRGPSITRLFTAAGAPMAPVVRPKPALDAADAVATSVPGFNPFGGTSAATPSAAGVATLVRSANPALTNAQVRTIMTDPTNAQACATATPATDCGSGFVMADLVVPDAQVGAVTTATPTVTGSNPAGPSSSTTPSVTGTAAAGTTVNLYGNSTCTGTVLGTGTAAAFSSTGITATVPANATTTIFAEATKAGEVVSACSTTSKSYTNDSVAPDTSITSPTAGGVAKSLTVPVSFTASETGSTFQCAVDGASFATCTSPQSLTVTSGSHTVQVKATDAAGNADATPASVTFTAYDCSSLSAAVTAAQAKADAAAKAVAKATKALKKAKQSHNASKIKKAKKKLKAAKAAKKSADAALAAAKAAAAPCA